MVFQNDTLYLVRTRKFGPLARLIAERLTAVGAAVAVAIDERHSESDTFPFEKLVIAESHLEALGFCNLPHNWRWLCGDLCYSIAADAFPEYQRFALVESDVYVPESSTKTLVSALASNNSDAIAAYLGPSEERRRFSRGLARFGLDPTWGCIFPISRVTRPVINEMTAFRTEQLRDAPDMQLNDEAILAGAILRKDFSHEALEEVVPKLIDATSFQTNPPHLFETVSAGQSDRRIFHPVVRFEEFLERLKTGEKAYSGTRLRNILRTAPEPMKRRIQKALQSLRDAPADNGSGLSRADYLVSSLSPDRRVRVLDVGANPLIEGEVSYQQLLDQGHAEVIGFEPQTDAYEALNERKSDAETYLPYALGDGSEATLRITRSPGFTSVFKTDLPSAQLLGFQKGMTEVASAPTQTHKLDDLQEVPEIDFLKIDVQGSETAIIANGRSKLAKAVVVQTEVRMFPLYEGEPSYGDLETELRRQGFQFLRYASLKHCPLSHRRYHRRLKRAEFAQAVDGDAFFVRDLRTIGQWDTEAIKRLAILADSVLDCPDLAIFALGNLVARNIVDDALIDEYIDQIPISRRREQP